MKTKIYIQYGNELITYFLWKTMHLDRFSIAKDSEVALLFLPTI